MSIDAQLTSCVDHLAAAVHARPARNDRYNDACARGASSNVESIAIERPTVSTGGGRSKNRASRNLKARCGVIDKRSVSSERDFDQPNSPTPTSSGFLLDS